MKVFLSSTYIDLIDHRKAAKEALERLGQQVGNMEVFGSRDEEPKVVALSEMEDCDLVVGLYAHRYGSIPKGERLSITEQEFHFAKAKNIPIFCFIVSDKYPWLPEMMENKPSSIKKLKLFKSMILLEKMVDFFTTPSDLGMKVGTTIGSHINRIVKKRTTGDERKSKGKSARSGSAKKAVMKGIQENVRGSTLPNQAYFFGRDKELQIIADAIAPESRTWGVLIDGPGGIGKTALAIRAAYLAPTALFERKIFITAKVRELTAEGEQPLKDFSRDNYFSMLNELALELGEEGVPRLAPDERANQLRIALAGKKTLIIFDNLETLQEDERTRLFQFLSRLPEGNKAIATSRRRRADSDARAIRLDRLSLHEALLLIEELARNNPRLARESENARRNLYEITNGNPLLIKWVCGQVGHYGSSMHTINEACKFINSAPRGNDPLEYIFGDLLATFTENETKVLAALTHFTQPVKLEWIADISNLNEQSAETALEDLSDRSILIETGEGQGFFLPPLAVQFIRKNRQEAVVETGIRLGDHAYQIATKKHKSQNVRRMKVLDSEWPYINAALVLLMLEDTDRFQEMSLRLYGFLEHSGRWDDYFWLCEAAEKNAKVSGNLIMAGFHAYFAGKLYFKRHQKTELKSCAERAEGYWQPLDKHTRVFILELKSYIALLEGDIRSSVKLARKNINLRFSLGTDEDNSTRELISNSLAELEEIVKKSSPKDRNKAVLNSLEGFIVKILPNVKKTKSDLDLAKITSAMATIEISRQNWSQGEKSARTSLSLAKKLGNQELIGDASLKLAVCLLGQHHFARAVPYARKAVQIYSNIREPDLEFAQEVLTACEQNKHTSKNQKISADQ